MMLTVRAYGCVCVARARRPAAYVPVCVCVCVCVYVCARACVVCACCVCVCVRACVRACSSAMFELLRRQKLDLLGSYYADNVNDGMRGNVRVPSPCSCSPPRAMSCDDCGESRFGMVHGNGRQMLFADATVLRPSPRGAMQLDLFPSAPSLCVCHPWRRVRNVYTTDAVVRRNGAWEQPARWRWQVLPV
jgi:hypothetical protein